MATTARLSSAVCSVMQETHVFDASMSAARSSRFTGTEMLSSTCVAQRDTLRPGVDSMHHRLYAGMKRQPCSLPAQPYLEGVSN